MSFDRIGILGRAARARTRRQLSWLAAVAIVLPLAVTPARAAGMWSDWDQPQAVPPAPPPVVRKRVLVPRVAATPKPNRHGAKTVINVPQEGAKPHGPLLIAVSINKQHVRIYDAEGLFAESPVSTGMRGHATPMGVFSIIQKSKYHRSNIYSGAPMPYMQRITWSGVALHAGVLPGYPASHGCIRMPMAFAVKMWGWTRMGARVIVAPDDVTPAAFAHPLLALRQPPAPQPAAVPPPTTSAPEAKDAAPAKSEPAKTEPAGSTENTPSATPDRAQNAEPASPDTLRPSITERVQVADASTDSAPARGDDRPAATDTPAPAASKPPVSEASDTTAAAGAAKAADAGGLAPAKSSVADAAPAAIAAPAPIMKGLPAPKPAAASKDAQATPAAADASPKRTGHVAVLISRKDSRLYVRQNFEPWFDAPISVSQSDRPLGTHVFTAEADAGGKDGYRWSVVTLPQLPKRVDVAEARPRAKRTIVTEEIQTPPPPEPKDALDRLTLPADVIARIASALAPGGSIIVSDRGPGDETGLGTDFILPLR